MSTVVLLLAMLGPICGALFLMGALETLAGAICRRFYPVYRDPWEGE